NCFDPWALGRRREYEFLKDSPILPPNQSAAQRKMRRGGLRRIIAKSVNALARSEPHGKASLGLSNWHGREIPTLRPPMRRRRGRRLQSDLLKHRLRAIGLKRHFCDAGTDR